MQLFHNVLEEKKKTSKENMSYKGIEPLQVLPLVYGVLAISVDDAPAKDSGDSQGYPQG